MACSLGARSPPPNALQHEEEDEHLTSYESHCGDDARVVRSFPQRQAATVPIRLAELLLAT